MMTGSEKLKATAVSPANIAFIKYWGQRDSQLTLPFNNSISMNLDHCLTTTTIEFSPRYSQDTIEIRFFGGQEKQLVGKRTAQVTRQINRLRKKAGIDFKAKMVSHNNFPSDAGIAASAAGFSALTLALASALKLNLDEKSLSIQTRLSGSGSACRSIIDGFAEWRAGNNSESSYAQQLVDEHHWDLVDIVVVVSNQKKKISSWKGHQRAETSPHFKTRLKQLPQRLNKVRQAINNQDFKLLGRTIEEEAVSLHVVCMTSKPAVFYWNGATLRLINQLRVWRQQGLAGYFTIDAGPNIHVICQAKNHQELNRRLKQLPGVKFTIVNRPAKGATIVNQHLF